MTASEWATLLVDGVLKATLTVDGEPKSERAQATLVGQLFTRFVGATFEVDGTEFVLKSTVPGTSNKSRKYWFEPLPVEGEWGNVASEAGPNPADPITPSLTVPELTEPAGSPS